MADKIILDYEVKLDGLKKEVTELKSQFKGAENAGVHAAKETEKSFKAATTSINRYGIETVKATTNADKSIQRVNKSTRDLATNTNKVADRTAAGFNKVGDSVRTVGKTTSNFGGQVSSLTGGLGQLAGAMGLAFSVQQIVHFGVESAKAFIDAEKNAQLLLFALKGNEAAQGRLMAQASRIQENTIFDDDSIQQAQTFLATQGRSEKQIQKVIDAAVELSTVTGVDLQTAVMQLDGTFEGNIGKLGKLDAAFKKLTPEQLANGAAADLLIEKYKGTAEAMGDTTAGQVQKLKNQFGELQETIGGGLVPQLTAYIDGLKGILSFDSSKFAEAQKNFSDIQFKNVENLLAMVGIMPNYIEELTDQEIAQKRIIAATEAEIEEKRKLIEAQGGSTAEFDKYVKAVRESQVVETFNQLSQALEITENQYKRLTDISDKYNASARISSDLIMSIKEATGGDLEAAFAKYNKTLGVTRQDFDDYIGQVKEIKPLQDDLAASTTKMVGPYDQLNQKLSAITKNMYDMITLGKDATRIDRNRFELQKKINEIQKQYNDLVQSHIPIEVNNKAAIEETTKNMNGLFTATSKALVPVKQLPFDMKAITDASKEQGPAIEDLISKWQEAASIAGALAELGQALNNALTQIFGEAAEKNAVFAAFQKAITISTITFKSIEAVANGVAAFSAGVSSGDPTKIIGGIASIVSGVGNLIGGLIQQVNAVQTPNAPSFYDGTPNTGVGGSLDSKGGFGAVLHPYEAVIPQAANMSEPGLAAAWINGNIDDYILGKWMPEYVEKNMGQLAANGYGEIDAILNDKNILDKMSRHTAVSKQTNFLLEQMVNKKSNPWQIS